MFIVTFIFLEKQCAIDLTLEQVIGVALITLLLWTVVIY